MARKRTGTIHESLEQLQQLERRYEGEPQEPRIRMLLLWKEDPERAAADVSIITGCSERSVRRWWATYTKKGIAALLELRAGEGGKEGGNEAMLLRKLRRNEFGSLDEVRDWLEGHDGVRHSRSEVQFMLKRVFACEPPWIDVNAPDNPGLTFDTSAIETDRLAIPSNFVRFLNALPQTVDTNEWSRLFRSALLLLFSDIDHIVLNINHSCDLRNPGNYSPTIVLRQHVSNNGANGKEVTVMADQEPGRPSEWVLHQLRLQGRPLDKYHPPCCFDYYYAGQAYLGSILLFRERGRAPIPATTLDTIDAMEPFIITSISNHVMWYMKALPAEMLFAEAVRQMKREARLSIQEERVAVFYLLGYTYEQMAKFLGISIMTVKRHVNSIHRKTKSRRLRELLARYLSPRLDFPDDEITDT